MVRMTSCGAFFALAMSLVPPSAAAEEDGEPKNVRFFAKVGAGFQMDKQLRAELATELQYAEFDSVQVVSLSHDEPRPSFVVGGGAIVPLSGAWSLVPSLELCVQPMPALYAGSYDVLPDTAFGLWLDLPVRLHVVGPWSAGLGGRVGFISFGGIAEGGGDRADVETLIVYFRGLLENHFAIGRNIDLGVDFAVGARAVEGSGDPFSLDLLGTFAYVF